MSEIEKFDPSTLMEGVRNRVKATFVSLIPDDQWELMIKKEVDDFFKTKDQYRSSREYVSDFSHLCQSVLKEYFEEKIREHIKQYESRLWENNAIKPNEMLIELIKTHSHEIFTSIFARMVQSAVINNIPRNY